MSDKPQQGSPGSNEGGQQTAQQTGAQPNRISAEDYGRLQGRFQSAPVPAEANACLCVMLNKRQGLTPETLNELFGFRREWCEGAVNAWNNGGMTMLQSYAGANSSPWGS